MEQRLRQKSVVDQKGLPSPSYQSSNVERSVGVPEPNFAQDKSDHDGAIEAQQASPCVPRQPPADPAPAEDDDSSMGDSSREAEQRGYNYLNSLAKAHRKDAEEISD